ncbi:MULTISPECIES: Hsp70 family protein [Corallincola]|uniref:Molecular chaperone HscC n=2 Tax=Corallincola TaxID=1775176 RepID=A0A368NSK7_9GAMM|nr:MULTISPECIES: molecular chaperone HscC [Corallincola]RCU52923.1 molecular chaperone HscC [Corallincola holothuriorum]TAA47923.1 molecular chaperone HscC [Corallincola spongiicola]
MKVGIDLGTTHSVIGVWQDTEVELIPDAAGNVLTPSVVSLSDDQYMMVGQAAKDRMAIYPQQTVAEFKRFLGTDKTYWLGDQSYTPVELSAIVLKALKEQAEGYLGEPVEEAVISVPAYFNNKQRQETQQAAELAGLQVERLINEPTAAALAYGLEQKDTEQTYLVLDLGGGTFDVSVIEVFDNTFEIHASAGDNHLGGNDFTNVLVEDLIANQPALPSHLPETLKRRLWSLCDGLKRRLTSESQAGFEYEVDGTQYRYEISEERFQLRCSELMERIKFPLNRAMSDAELSLDDIDGLIMVGGATRMPVFRQQVSRLFSRIPQSHYQPDHAIAVGAAIQAGVKARSDALREVIMTDVCPYTLGVEVLGRHDQTEFLPVIERNTTIPVSETRSVYSTHPAQKEVLLHIYQGESFRPQDNVFLGELKIRLSPIEKIQELYLTYTYDLNGVLEVEVTEVSSGKKYRTYVSEGDDDLNREQLEQNFARLNALKILPKDKLANTTFMAKLERLYQEKLGKEREAVGTMLADFSQVLKGHDNSAIEQMMRRIKVELDYADID